MSEYTDSEEGDEDKLELELLEEFLDLHTVLTEVSAIRFMNPSDADSISSADEKLLGDP